MNDTTNIDMMYREQILDLYRNPLNKKALDEFDVEHRELNPTCGDEISVQVKFDKEGRVEDIGHQGQGCAISQASVSLVTDEVKNKTKIEITSMTDTDVHDLLGFKPVYTRQKCATLGLKAVQKAAQTKRIH